MFNFRYKKVNKLFKCIILININDFIFRNMEDNG